MTTIRRIVTSQAFAVAALVAFILGVAALLPGGDGPAPPDPDDFAAAVAVVPQSGPAEWPNDRVRAVFHAAVKLRIERRAAYLDAAEAGLSPEDAKQVRAARRFLLTAPVSTEPAP